MSPVQAVFISPGAQRMASAAVVTGSGPRPGAMRVAARRVWHGLFGAVALCWHLLDSSFPRTPERVCWAIQNNQ